MAASTRAAATTTAATATAAATTTAIATTRTTATTAATAAALARALIRVRSGPSPCAGEARAAEVLERWAGGGEAGDPRAELQVEMRPLPGDRWGRRDVLLTLPGATRGPGVLLLGHLDTVGTSDFGKLERWAADPEELERRRPLGRRWMQGRGALDMKAGVAAGAAALLALARVPRAERRGPVALLVTADEEHASAGIRAARGWPALRRARWSLAVSLDFVPPPPRGFHGRLYLGTVGKCLAGVLMRVPPSHAAERAGDPDAAQWAAELIRRHTARRPAGCALRGPAVLRARDLKPEYDTQLPESFALYFNVLGDPLDPRAALDALEEDVRAAWRAAGAGRPLARGAVARARAGQAAASDEDGAQTWDVALDRVRAAGGRLPGATLFFAPPYYASRHARGAAQRERAAALKRLARRLGLKVGQCYPFISESSFLGPTDDPAYRAWRRHCPVSAPAPGIGLDVLTATLGPWGRGAHRPEEAVRADYAFGRLPHILEACVREIWSMPGGRER